MATVRKARDYQRMVLQGIDWKGYVAIGRVLADRPGLRLTYDQGVLEFMTTSPEHEHFKRLIDRLLTAWAEEMGLAMTCLGSMTFQRRRLRRGLEPDQCYWIAHEAQVRSKNRIDFRVDPPPDLVLEIDISRSSMNRMAMYGQMGVPEVWRFRRGALAFLARQADGAYAETPTSLSLPPLTAADLTPFLAMRASADEIAIIRQFRAWIRSKFPGGAPTTP